MTSCRCEQPRPDRERCCCRSTCRSRLFRPPLYVPENPIVNVPGNPVTVNAVEVQLTAAGCVSGEPTEPVTPLTVPLTAPDRVMLPVSDVPLCVSANDTLAPKP